MESGFTLKRVRDMTRRYSQIHRKDKYSNRSLSVRSRTKSFWVGVQLQSLKLQVARIQGVP